MDKNIFLIPTDRPSRLHNTFNVLRLEIGFELSPNNQNIYITSDEKIKNCYVLTDLDKIVKVDKNNDELWHQHNCKKIILTTDQDLIKDGVQQISDEFLEWFVKNPNCEEVEVDKWASLNEGGYSYHITIPKEEPKPIHEQIIDAVGGKDRFREIAGLKSKQETELEEALNKLKEEHTVLNLYPSNMLKNVAEFGAKSQAKRMYSEEEVIQIQKEWNKFNDNQDSFNGQDDLTFKEWFIKNPSCEFVETERLENGQYVDRLPDGSVIEGVYENYKIIIPPEKPKQEYNNINYGGGFTEEDIQRVSTKQKTLEEAAKIESEYLADYEDKEIYQKGFIEGSKHQAERMYSEEEVWGVINIVIGLKDLGKTHVEISQYFEQIKKKN